MMVSNSSPHRFISGLLFLFVSFILTGCGAVQPTGSQFRQSSQASLIAVTPAVADLRPGQALQFAASVANPKDILLPGAGTNRWYLVNVREAVNPAGQPLSMHGTNNRVVWSVNGMPGGNPTLGKIDNNGLYHAPSKISNPIAVSVTAVSAAFPGAAGTATITVRNVISIPASPSGNGPSAPPASNPPGTSPNPLAIAANSLPVPVLNHEYVATLVGDGGTPPYTWGIISGHLPAGLTLSSSGVISGKPIVPGTYTFGVQAKDSSSQTARRTDTFSITENQSANIVWSADMESGDLSQWFQNWGGGLHPTANGTAFATQEMAHSRGWSAKVAIAGPYSPDAAMRMFRWSEPRNPAYFDSGLYYSAWIYIPQLYTLTHSPHTGNFWNLMQFKSKTWQPTLGNCSQGSGTSTANDPVWALMMQNRVPQTASPLYLRLIWGAGGVSMNGPYQSSSLSLKSYDSLQPTLNVPIGKWFQVEMYLKEWPHDLTPFQGRIMVWQDGVLLYDMGRSDDPNGGVVTKYGDDLDGANLCHGDNQWSVNAYSDGVSPDPAIIYVDDAKIATGFVQ